MRNLKRRPQRQRDQDTPILAQDRHQTGTWSFGRFLTGLPLRSNNVFSAWCFREVDGIQLCRDMLDDNRCADASLVGRSVRWLATAATVVALLRTVAVAATTGDMERLRLPPQVLARPQVYDVWIALDSLGARPRNHRPDRTSEHARGSDIQSQASEAYRRNSGLSPGTTSQSQENPRPLAETQLTAMQQKVEEARTQMVAAEKRVTEA